MSRSVQNIIKHISKRSQQYHEFGDAISSTYPAQTLRVSNNDYKPYQFNTISTHMQLISKSSPNTLSNISQHVQKSINTYVTEQHPIIKHVHPKHIQKASKKYQNHNHKHKHAIQHKLASTIVST